MSHSQEMSEAEEGTITLGEFVSLNDHLEESATAVLGAADDKNCTYNQGYLKRQALYACLTCTPDVCDPAGFCLACNYHCHDGHNIVELYTKRNFRCDCGNQKFGDKKCTLEPSKDNLNINNVYNQNYKGKYCTCARPYPDEEDPTPDEMIQCALCEDWYHGRHLEVDQVPEEYCEMTCPHCVNKFNFLKLYPQLLVKIPNSDKKEDSPDIKDKQDVELENVPNGTEKEESNDISVEERSSAEKPNEAMKTDSSINVLEEQKTTKRNDEKEGVISMDGVVAIDSESTKGDGDNVEIETVKPKECLIKGRDFSNLTKSGALFWADEWRSKICSCVDCLKLYANGKISFITDESEMIEEYEKKGLESPPPNPDADLAFLSTLDRTQQVEIITEYNDMKEKLVDYLKSFQGGNKVVKAEDIHKFFSNLKDCKRRRLNDDCTPPSFCR